MKHFRLYLMPLLLLLLLLASRLTSQAQSVGIGTTTPNAAAALDIRASDKGLLIPRLSAAQRTGIGTPPQGLMVYQTDGSAGGGPGTGFWYFGGNPAAWVFINPAGGAADNLGNHTATTNLNLGANAVVGTGASIGAAVGVGVRADGGLNLGQNTAGNNVFLGYQAGAANTTGRLNQFSGYQSGLNNTTGIGNLFSGPSSGFTNTSGDQNQFTGVSSGYRNTTGDQNQFSGFQSGFGNTSGNRNQFSGFQSGFQNTSGSGNQFNGFNSGFANTTGSNNYFDGYNSGLRNTSGSNNHFSGYLSGESNTRGAFNQFTGNQSGYSTTTGNFNQFDGYRSGYDNTTGFQNYFSGYQSGTNNTTGSNNAFSGQSSGFNNLTGDGNTFSGNSSGRYNTTGDDNTALGSRSGPANGSGNLTNATAIGANVSLTQSNTLVLGNGANVGIGTSAPLTKLSITPTALEPKITLFDNGSTQSHHGFGVSNGQLNYHVTNRADSHVFYSQGKNGPDGFGGLELLRIQGDGRVGIGTSSPDAKLEVVGDILVEEVHRDRTGAANLVPVAYGRIRENGTTASGTGNFASSKSSGNFYKIEFSSASSLSQILFSNYIVLVTTNNGATGAVVNTNIIGELEVLFPISIGPGATYVSNGFSFVVYIP